MAEDSTQFGGNKFQSILWIKKQVVTEGKNACFFNVVRPAWAITWR
jgi:hypothetical protein